MDKFTTLQQIQNLIAENQINENEVLNLFQQNKKVIKTSKSHIIILSIGAILLFIGVATLIQMNWGSLNSISRILITLVLGYIFYIAGQLYLQKENHYTAGIINHFISVTLLPTGFFVTAHELGLLGQNTLNISTIIFAILTIHYLLSYLNKPNSLFLFFTIAYINIFYSYLSSVMYQYILIDFNFLTFHTVFGVTLGIANLLVSAHFNQNNYKFINRFLNIYATFLILITTFIQLENFVEGQNIFVDLLYLPILGLFTYIGSLKNKKSILVPTAIMFTIYLISLSNLYFVNTLGWPVSLIIIGTTLIIGKIQISKLVQKIHNKNVSDTTNL